MLAQSEAGCVVTRAVKRTRGDSAFSFSATDIQRPTHGWKKCVDNEEDCGKQSQLYKGCTMIYINFIINLIIVSEKEYRAYFPTNSRILSSVYHVFLHISQTAPFSKRNTEHI